MSPSLSGCRYRLVVLVSCTRGVWHVQYGRDGIASREAAEMLGREEVVRTRYRTPWRRVAYRIEEN